MFAVRVGLQKFNIKHNFEIESIITLYARWIREGKLKVNSDWNKERKIKFTVQDPCQLVRKSLGDPVAEDLRFVTINGHRFKRLILHDSYLAAGIERNLEAFGESAYFPRLVARHENEIWVEFVEGEPLRTADDDQ